MEIGEVFHFGIFAAEKFLAFGYLLGYGFRGLAVGRIKRAVVAEGASTMRDVAVAVGA